MSLPRIGWPALVGVLAVGCLLPRPSGAEWASSAASERQNLPPEGSGHVRFVTPADTLAPAPISSMPTSEEGTSQAVWITKPQSESSTNFAIADDGRVVEASHVSSIQGGPALRTAPATKGALLESVPKSGTRSNDSAIPHKLFSRSQPRATANRTAAAPAPPSLAPDLTQSRAALRAVSQPDRPRSPAPARPDVGAERLLAEAHQLSTSASTSEDFSRIISICRRSLAAAPEGPATEYARQLAAWALNRRGQLMASAGDMDKALDDFQMAVRLDPRCWRAIHNRGVILAQSGRFGPAFDDFTRTIQLQPDYPKAYSNRAALLVVANKVEKAADDYRQAIELAPNLAVAHRGRARCCHTLGKLDEALQHYNAAAQLEPDSGYTLACRADLLTDLGRYVEAADDYDRALQLDPQSVEAYRGSAWLLATCPDGSVRNAELAVKRAKAALQLNRKNEAINYDTLAAALASAGEFRGAVQAIQRAIELAPGRERLVYRDRLQLYQHSQPFRMAPLRAVSQASYQY